MKKPDLSGKVLVLLRQVAWGPTSGNDRRCAFCNSFPPEHRKYRQQGFLQDCPVMVARSTLKNLGEETNQYEKAETT